MHADKVVQGPEKERKKTLVERRGGEEGRERERGEEEMEIRLLTTRGD